MVEGSSVSLGWTNLNSLGNSLFLQENGPRIPISLCWVGRIPYRLSVVIELMCVLVQGNSGNWRIWVKEGQWYNVPWGKLEQLLVCGWKILFCWAQGGEQCDVLLCVCQMDVKFAIYQWAQIPACADIDIHCRFQSLSARLTSSETRPNLCLNRFPAITDSKTISSVKVQQCTGAW